MTILPQETDTVKLNLGHFSMTRARVDFILFFFANLAEINIVPVCDFFSEFSVNFHLFNCRVGKI